jgi:YebC/PmpR family DNA-binding regulatory protein
MGGHSHWKGIKEKKGRVDAKRGKLFAKLLRAIEISARQGDPNPDNNPTLADAIQRAKDGSVPRDTIERAIKRASGEGAGAAAFERVFYEGYAPGGVAVLVEALTDNRNRTSQDLRSIFTKSGGNLGEPGSVQWLFLRRGVLLVDKSDAPGEEELMGVVLDAGADDLRDDVEQWEILVDPPSYEKVKEALETAQIPIANAEITQVPQNRVAVDGSDARAVLKLIDALEDHDDVQAVYANFDIPEAVLAEVG